MHGKCPGAAGDTALVFPARDEAVFEEVDGLAGAHGGEWDVIVVLEEGLVGADFGDEWG